MIEVFLNEIKVADFKQDNTKYLLDYKNFDIEKSICLSLSGDSLKEIDDDIIRAWK
jgi:hypothetical protein